MNKRKERIRTNFRVIAEDSITFDFTSPGVWREGDVCGEQEEGEGRTCRHHKRCFVSVEEGESLPVRGHGSGRTGKA